MPEPSLLERLKQRKIIQWAFAYLAGAWVVVQLLDAVKDPMELSPAVHRGILAVLAVGFLLTLVLAWYHGEKGRQRVSGPELLMVAALLVVAGVALAFLDTYEGREGTAPLRRDGDRVSIALLPLDDNSPDPDDAFFADGVHEELVTRLSRISALDVISRSSLEQYRDRETRPAIPEIAGDLGGVDYLLEGSARVGGGQVRITVQLIDGQRDVHVWSDSFDSPYAVDDFIRLQSEIAQQIAQRIQVEITPQEAARMSALPTESQEAYDLYLRAMTYWNRRADRQEALAITQDMLEQAIQIDPTFALAFSQLSYLHGYLYRMGYDQRPDRLEAQRTAADSALALKPDLSQARFAAGYAHYVSGELQDALEEFSMALEGLPSDARTVALIGYTHRRLGNWTEVLAAYERAVELNPRAYHYDLGGNSYYILRRYREAISAYDRALQLAPDHTGAAWQKGLAYLGLQGQMDTLRAMVEGTPGMSDWERFWLHVHERDWRGARRFIGPGPDSVEIDLQVALTTKSLWSAWLHQGAGDREAALAAFDSARAFLEGYTQENPEDDRVHYGLGHAYAGLGQIPEAIRSAERFYLPWQGDSHDGPWRAGLAAEIYATAGLVDETVDLLEPLLAGPSEISVNLLRISWFFDPVRDHPRFQALLDEYRDGVEH